MPYIYTMNNAADKLFGLFMRSNVSDVLKKVHAEHIGEIFSTIESVLQALIRSMEFIEEHFPALQTGTNKVQRKSKKQVHMQLFNEALQNNNVDLESVGLSIESVGHITDQLVAASKGNLKIQTPVSVKETVIDNTPSDTVSVASTVPTLSESLPIDLGIPPELTGKKKKRTFSRK
ncbi:TPA_asm: hypothetical protein [Capsaspora MELD virus 1]|nr:TPA_asm: hypothetical protein [Capsaspora MELD virus 1]